MIQLRMCMTINDIYILGIGNDNYVCMCMDMHTYCVHKYGQTSFISSSIYEFINKLHSHIMHLYPVYHAMSSYMAGYSYNYSSHQKSTTSYVISNAA